jgi:hypothetical protein
MKIKEFLKKIWNSWGNCEFKKECPYFSKDSGVCLNGGGEYCGQWREFVKQKYGNRERRRKTK